MSKVTATWDDVFGKTDPVVRNIAEALRKLINTLHPETVECPYPGYGSVNFGFGQKMSAEAYLYLMVQKDRVNLGFFRGTSLPDPTGLLEGNGKALRHIKVASIAKASEPNVVALVSAAIEERRRALNLV